MKQHIGAPSIPVVKVKDEVHVGTLIAQAGGYVSANIISSVSGIVKRIEKRQDASGHYQDAVVIENDGNYIDEEIEIFKEYQRNKIKHYTKPHNKSLFSGHFGFKSFFRFFIKPLFGFLEINIDPA